ncbi:hypothetical protein NM208_g5210 [Fusarium decemcellulare]|uniref:Uncharacterized protein n=2 Tax=Fusarium decemcellulare TaxID=57161 RepID=A0ACC1SGV4_9HYPO|nr:hypothetical protein NM208_g5471 [Fusarium decemcellulare]KAJ3540092.1 hypothetical protein NM208_g5210 [Fusarium decemcellulare]
MTSQQSPHNTSETCSTPGYPPETRKRKRSASGSQPAREYGLMRDTGEHDAARFVGSSSGIHYIRTVHLRLATRFASRTTESSALSTLIPGEDDQLRQGASVRRNHQQLLWKSNEVCSDSADCLPSFEDFVEWSKSYFESWHPVLPFLQGPEILRLFEDASKNELSSMSSLNRVILRSILSISLADSRQGTAFQKPIPKHFVFESVDDAVANSQFALSQPASIRSTQAALAIQLFLTSMLCLNAASRLGGLIVRMAFHMGLHRCPTKYPFFTAEEGSVRRRVFWCIYTLERLLSQSLGLPLDIQDDDLDVCYPGEERHATTAGVEEGVEKLQLLTFVAKHGRIRGLILELRNKSILKRQDTADRTAFVQTELAKWSNDIQDAVEEDDLAYDSSDGAESTPTISPNHRLMLLILKHESAICLNRPGLASEYPSSSYSSAFQACISAAKSIFILLKKHRNRHPLIADSTRRRLQTPLLWPSFTWAVWISAFVLIHAAFERQVPLESAMRHVAAGKDTLSHLATRDTSWPEYCLEAIEELISAVQELSHPQNPSLESPTDASISVQGLSRTLAPQNSNDTPTRSRGTLTAWGQHTTGRSNDASSFPTRDLSAVPEQPPNSNTSRSHHDRINSFGPSTGNTLWQQRQPQQHQPGSTTPLNGSDAQLRLSSVSRLNNTHETASFPMAPGPPDSNLDSIPVEGQESIMWYDQLFASSFSAIDNPFLVAAEFDANIDPTWNYLR